MHASMLSIRDGLLADPPSGFEVEPLPDGFAIKYRPRFVGCGFLFLSVWAALWFFVCCTLLVGGLVQGPNPMLVLSVLFALLGALSIFTISRELLTKRSYQFEGTTFRIVKEILGTRTQSTMDRSEVGGIRIKRTIYPGRAARATWTVYLEGARNLRVICTSSHRQSQWLVEVLREWSDAPVMT